MYATYQTLEIGMPRKKRTKAVAGWFAHMDASRRQYVHTQKSCQRREARQRALFGKLQQAESLLHELGYTATLLVRATLLSHGIQVSPDRQRQTREGSSLPVSWTTAYMFSWPEGSNLLSLMKQVDEADPTSQPRLRSILRAWMIWQYPIVLASRTDEAYLQLIAGNRRKQRERLIRERDAFMAPWGIEQTTVLEQLLLRWISAGWLRVQFVESLVARTDKEESRAVEYLPGLQELARKQMQVPVEYLHTVRELRLSGIETD